MKRYLEEWGLWGCVHVCNYHFLTMIIAAAAPRFMSGRVPLPAPTWPQDKALDSIIPGDLDQATGLDREEVLANLAGKQLFPEEGVSTYAHIPTHDLAERFTADWCGETAAGILGVAPATVIKG